MTTRYFSVSPKNLAREAAAAIATATGVKRHDIALTLGSGWGKAADLLGKTVTTLPADDVPGFPLQAFPVTPEQSAQSRCQMVGLRS